MTFPTISPTVAAVGSNSPAPVSFPELYERLLVAPLFRPWAEQLLERLPLAAGARVLDVACGTGIVARLTRARLGGEARIVGVDPNAGMLEIARQLEPTIDWRQGSAAELPVKKEERFDAVCCHQGLQFFPDRLAAVRELWRVLAPGGRIAIGVWRSVEENGLFHDLGRVAERFLGPVHDARHGFADADALKHLLTDAGFSDVSVEQVTLETRFGPDPSVLPRLNAMALVGMSAMGKGMSESERADMVTRIVEASLDVVSAYARDGEIAFPTSANLATARIA